MLGVVRTKRKSYSSVNYNKLLHALERDKLPQSSVYIDRNSCGAIFYLIILKESTPEKGELIMVLKPETYKKEFCHQLNVPLSRYRIFFVTNDFDMNKYFQLPQNIHFACEANVHGECNLCKNEIIDEYTFKRNPLVDEDTCCCQIILPFCVECLNTKVISNRKKIAYMKCCKCNSNIMELNIVTFKPYSSKTAFNSRSV